MTPQSLAIIIFLVHAEIFAYVVYYSIVAHVKHIYTSAYDDKLAISFGIYGLLGIGLAYLMFFGRNLDVQITLIVCQSLCIFICGITLGLKMHSNLKKEINPQNSAKEAHQNESFSKQHQ